MDDPFPAAPRWLATATAPLAEALHLHTLPLHIHEIAAAALLYAAVQRASPHLSTALLPHVYPALPRHTRLSWDVHVVSFVQSLLIDALALWLMRADAPARAALDPIGRVWAYSGGGGLLQAMAAGYFLWDLVVTVQNVKVFGIGMLAHAISALAVYALGFRPFVNFYAPNFILYELSSPFLNIHWFLDKVNMTGSRAQWYNGMVLLTTFFCCRLVWGTYASVCVFRDIFVARRAGPLPPASVAATAVELAARERGLPPYATAAAAAAAGDPLSFARLAGDAADIPTWLAGAYLAANLTLNALNWFWFNRMIETVRKRFRTAVEAGKVSAGPEKTAQPVDGAAAREDSAAGGDVAKLATGAAVALEQVAEEVRRRVVEGEMGPPGEDDDIGAQ